jgi:hypothetical protein
MRLRGAFDPKVQISLGVLMVLIFVASVIWLRSNAGGSEPILDWVRLDLRVTPISFLLGLAAGWKIGQLRLRALRMVLPEVDGHLFLSQQATLSKLREGENAIKLQRLGFISAFLAWFALTTFTNGRVMLYGSLTGYVVGQYLTGQTFPFVRLAVELRNKQLGPQ